MKLRLYLSLLGGFPKPLYSFDCVLWHAGTLGIADSKRVLSAVKALFCRPAIPLSGLSKVLCDAKSALVANAEAVLGKWKPLFSGLANPSCELTEILSHAVAYGIHSSEP